MLAQVGFSSANQSRCAMCTERTRSSVRKVV
jgi:hypothetical protein